MLGDIRIASLAAAAAVGAAGTETRRIGITQRHVSLGRCLGGRGQRGQADGGGRKAQQGTERSPH